MRSFILMVVVLCAVSCGTTNRGGTALRSGNADPGITIPQQTPSADETQVKQVLLDQFTFVIKRYSEDTTYGYTEQNPVKVGGVQEGPLNERRFLNALTGPGGERLTYNRLGSCCSFDTPRSPFGRGLLDKYEVTYKGLKEPVIIYINMYDSEELMVPVGFRLKVEFDKGGDPIPDPVAML